MRPSKNSYHHLGRFKLPDLKNVKLVTIIVDVFFLLFISRIFLNLEAFDLIRCFADLIAIRDSTSFLMLVRETALLPGAKLVSENVNSNSSNDFSGIKPGRDNRGGGKRNVLQFLCNFSSIDQKRAEA